MSAPIYLTLADPMRVLPLAEAVEVCQALRRGEVDEVEVLARFAEMTVASVLARVRGEEQLVVPAIDSAALLVAAGKGELTVGAAAALAETVATRLEGR